MSVENQFSEAFSERVDRREIVRATLHSAGWPWRGFSGFIRRNADQRSKRSPAKSVTPFHFAP
jgi:hypothetical protein